MLTFTQFEKKLITKAKQKRKRIIFPEADDERIQEAVKYLKQKKIVEPIFVGNKKKLEQLCKKKKINIEIIDVYDKKLQEKYTKKFTTLRKKKGMISSKAKKIMQDPIYVATFLVNDNKAHGLVSGASHPTAHTLRPAIQIFGAKAGFKKISSHFIMTRQKDIFLFADCGVQIAPNAKELAEIATLSIKSAQSYGLKPKVAMLSFSTKGSASHPFVSKVQEATQITKQKNRGIPIEGEIQFDAAFVPQIRKKKAPKSQLKGIPNVFIFPDLQAGNICYKVVQHISNFDAIGPIVQGLKKPVNDLSRGCSVKEVILAAAITALQ